MAPWPGPTEPCRVDTKPKVAQSVDGRAARPPGQGAWLERLSGASKRHMGDYSDLIDGLGDAAGALATALSSIWIPVQLGIIFTAAVVAWGVALFVRTRADLVTLTMGW